MRGHLASPLLNQSISRCGHSPELQNHMPTPARSCRPDAPDPSRGQGPKANVRRTDQPPAPAARAHRRSPRLAQNFRTRARATREGSAPPAPVFSSLLAPVHRDAARAAHKPERDERPVAHPSPTPGSAKERRPPPARFALRALPLPSLQPKLLPR
jgi:hypothetical protein